MTGTRRHFLRQATGITVAASAGLFAARLGAQSNGPACYDPAALPFTQKSRRRALGYVDASPDATRHCSLCAFFTAAAAGCGTCQMLTGGPVNAGALCNSFAPKAAK
ncbi:high-potential iron-sulfur protein [Novosphingobium sp. BL-8A]|uniref:high-potential iron-sulfur protein n=1 Tax=Novosphingobium sp. BL-8A TaxID=3127639 RepID=UPI00375658D0